MFHHLPGTFTEPLSCSVGVFLLSAPSQQASSELTSFLILNMLLFGFTDIVMEADEVSNIGRI